MHFAPTEVWAPPRSREQAQVLQRPARARHRCVRMVLVALALRLAVAPLLYQQQLDPQRDHWPFGYEAGRIARSIVQGRGFGSPLFAETGPTAWMHPAYPYIRAGIFKVAGGFYGFRRAAPCTCGRDIGV